VNLEELLTEIPVEKFSLLSREDLETFAKLEQKMRIQFQKENDRLRAINDELKQDSFYIEEQFINIRNKFFGKSSEKKPRTDGEKSHFSGKKAKKKKIQLPSLRYPNAPLIEREVELAVLLQCSCCGAEMKDTGMTEDSEFLTVVPAEFMVVRQRRHKYGCGKCYSSIITAPAPPTIKAGSSYSDAMKIDVALSKYCDLIPVERYSSIAGRAGLMDLPPQSLIESTHHLADFVSGAYDKSKSEAIKSKVLHADETPHKMLEGTEIKNWYLWGFSTARVCFFEIHDTRSGDVPSELLINSKCEFLMSDVFSGYAKAVRQANEYRRRMEMPVIQNIYCNAHARRKFKDANKFPEEAKYFIDQYEKIYRLEKIAQARPHDRILRVRRIMVPLFEAMKARAMANSKGYFSKSSIGKAMAYFLKNYDQLTLFLKNPDLPIDNNPQERLMRNPVIGRKTWYGTHSERGAKTAAILFTLVESCKLVEVNPREYFKKLVQDLHHGKEAYTPWDFKQLSKNH